VNLKSNLKSVLFLTRPTFIIYSILLPISLLTWSGTINYLPWFSTILLILATFFGFSYNVVLNNITDSRVDKLKSVWLNPIAKGLTTVEFAHRLLKIYIILFVITFSCFLVSIIFYSRLTIFQILTITLVTIFTNILGVIYNKSIDRTWLINLSMVFSFSLTTIVFTITSTLHLTWFFTMYTILVIVIQILNQYQEYEIECMVRKTPMCSEKSRRINLWICKILTITLLILGYVAWINLHILTTYQFITFEAMIVMYLISTSVAIYLEYSKNPKIKIIKNIIKHLLIEILMRWLATRILYLTWLITLMI